MVRSFFPRDVFAELDRMQRQLQGGFDGMPSIRGLTRGSFPALNVGGTAKSVEIYAFAPGLDASSIDVEIERGVLTVSGERKRLLPPADARATVHVDERFDGRFRRVVSLPDDIDPDAVRADYRDGVLHISLPRRESSLPRRIQVD